MSLADSRQSGVTGMTKSVTALACLLLVASQVGAVRDCHAAGDRAGAGTSRIVAFAMVKFPELTRGERALLEFAQAGNVERTQFATAGSNPDPADKSNDPKDAEKWDSQRNIRAGLIRWLLEEPE